MANFYDKVSMRTAITDHTKLDLSHQHITTAGWFQMNPVLLKECIPGEKVSVDLMTYSKMQSLVTPTFGRANIKLRVFKVPMHTIFRGWNDFITDTPHVFSGADNKTVNIIPTVPTVSNLNLLLSFTTGVLEGIGETFVTAGTMSNYDVIAVNSTGGTVPLLFTSYGRQWLKVLNSLGYQMVWDERNTDVYSALPLMAYMKAVMDWYYPGQYINTGLYADVMGILNYDGSSPLVLNSSIIAKFATLGLYSNYDQDPFVSAFDNPVAPTNGVYSSFYIKDITSVGQAPTGMGNNGDWYHPFTSSTSVINDIGVSNRSLNGTPISTMNLRSGNTNSPRLGMTVSDYQHKALSLLSDYMRRHQIAGAASISRYLSRFGMELKSEKEKRSDYISSKMVPLNINEVMSNSNAQSQDQSAAGITGLGSFAGAGSAFDSSFKFEVNMDDEYGYLIVIASIVPAIGYVQGCARHTMHKTKLDFFTPEYDGLSVQAISTRQLFNTLEDTAELSTSGSSYMSYDKTIFGFEPKYAEYKYMTDKLSGDFVCNSLNVGNSNSSSWHLFRMFNKEDFVDDNGNYSFGALVHNRSFVTGLADHHQYNRIFSFYPSDEKNMPDPFTVIYNFQMVSYAPCRPLYDTYDFSELDRGSDVNMTVNGVKAN